MSASLRATYFLLTGLWLPRHQLSHQLGLEVISAWDRTKLVGNEEQARIAILRLSLTRTWLNTPSYERALAWAVDEAPHWWKLKPGEVVDTSWLEDRAVQYFLRGRTR